MEINQPPQRPRLGVTFPAGNPRLLNSSIAITVDATRDMVIELLDCFAMDMHSDPGFSRVESAAIHAAITVSSGLAVTIPAPTSSGPNGWLRSLADNRPKPGWIWVDLTDTINEILVQLGDRRNVPPYPQRVASPAHSRPASQPQAGLTMLCQPVRCERDDTWRVITHGGNELVVSLIDCYNRDTAIAFNESWSAMERNRSTLAVTIPRPLHCKDWIESLTIPGSEHAGWIWLDESTTLNQWLVQEDFATEMPF